MNQFDPAEFKRQEEQAYSQVAQSYEQYADRAMAPYLPSLLEGLRLQPGRSVLDVACGTGMDALNAAPMVGPGGRVVGVDLAPGMVSVATLEVKAPQLIHMI